jgi:hypothetical protein
MAGILYVFPAIHDALCFVCIVCVWIATTEHMRVSPVGGLSISLVPLLLQTIILYWGFWEWHFCTIDILLRLGHSSLYATAVLNMAGVGDVEH